MSSRLVVAGWLIRSGLAQSLGDGADDALLGYPPCLSDSLLDRIGVRATVSNDYNPVDAQKWRAAHFVGVELVAYALQGRLGQSAADLGPRAGHNIFTDGLPHIGRHRLGRFHHDVAGEAVDDGHIGVAAHELFGFDVADIIEVAGLH